MTSVLSALRDQGERRVRALGLLRDAWQVLTGAGLARPAEAAAACIRSAADNVAETARGPQHTRPEQPPLSAGGVRQDQGDLVGAVDASTAVVTVLILLLGGAPEKAGQSPSPVPPATTVSASHLLRAPVNR